MMSQVIMKGKKVMVMTQQYDIGLYVAIYDTNNNFLEQHSFQMPEAKFHKKLRKNYKTWR